MTPLKYFKLKKLALTSVLLSLAMIIGVAETMLPPVFPALPFFRLGLSNVVILLAILLLGYFKTSILVVSKSFLVPIFAANPIMILYSLPSAFLSFCLSFTLIKMKKLGIISISFLSAILNNLVQIFVAAILTKSAAVFYYFPYLVLLGGLSGILTGALLNTTIKAIPEKLFS